MGQNDGVPEISTDMDGGRNGADAGRGESQEEMRGESQEGMRGELRDLRERMSAIKEEVAADVDRKWGTPWRTTDVFDLKVQTRLTGHSEYRSLRVRIGQVEAALAGQPDAGAEKPGR